MNAMIFTMLPRPGFPTPRKPITAFAAIPVCSMPNVKPQCISPLLKIIVLIVTHHTRGNSRPCCARKRPPGVPTAMKKSMML